MHIHVYGSDHGGLRAGRLRAPEPPSRYLAAIDGRPYTALLVWWRRFLTAPGCIKRRARGAKPGVPHKRRQQRPTRNAANTTATCLASSSSSLDMVSGQSSPLSGSSPERHVLAPGTPPRLTARQCAGVQCSEHVLAGQSSPLDMVTGQSSPLSGSSPERHVLAPGTPPRLSTLVVDDFLIDDEMTAHPPQQTKANVPLSCMYT